MDIEGHYEMKIGFLVPLHTVVAYTLVKPY